MLIENKGRLKETHLFFFQIVNKIRASCRKFLYNACSFGM